MTIPLYELAAMRDVLTGWLEEVEGEVTPTLEALLADQEGAENEKIERVALFIREQLATVEAIKIEEDRLTARRKARENKVAGLKDYLQRNMERIGTEKVQGLLCTVALQRSPPAVTTALTSDDLGGRYARGDREFITEIPASYRLNREAVLAAWKAQQQIPEAVLVTQSRHLRIR